MNVDEGFGAILIAILGVMITVAIAIPVTVVIAAIIKWGFTYLGLGF